MEQWELILKVIEDLKESDNDNKEQQINEVIQEGRFLEQQNMLD